jgi:hypothetical protein
VYLGRIKGTTENVYLMGFQWDCDWYYGGGYIKTRGMHTHFDNCFLNIPDIRGHALGNFVTPWTKLDDRQKQTAEVISNGCSIWEDLGFFLDFPQFTDEWWRIKDLYKQFYKLRDAAEVFRHGGHCTGKDRNPKEFNKEMADKINLHLQDVVIPEIMKALKVG